MKSYSDLNKRLVDRADAIEDVRRGARDSLQGLLEHFILVTDTPRHSVHIGQMINQDFRELGLKGLSFKPNGDVDFAIGIDFTYTASGNSVTLIVPGDLSRQSPNPHRPRIRFAQGDSRILNDPDEFAEAMNRAISEAIENFNRPTH